MLKQVYHFLWAFISAVFYRFPSKSIAVIGVTGTKGKSTTVNLAHQILQENGYKTASLSSIRFRIGNKEEKNTLKMTMPGRFGIQRFLRRAVNNNCDFVVLEVTSEGIAQHRHRFIDFDVATLTNLSKEHIERHKGFENYKKAKGELFIQTPIHILNLNSKKINYFLNIPASNKYGYECPPLSFKQKTASKNQPQPDSVKKDHLIKAEEVEELAESIKFKINNISFHLNLLGKFNVYNALAAITIAYSQGIAIEKCKAPLESSSRIPGRMEKVVKQPFSVIVDYAHTPQSLEEVYKTTASNIPKETKLIGVLGACGGGRDRWKRPEMGKIAVEYCNKIILTNEDPYDEDPHKILDEIKGGVVANSGSENIVEEIIDRREAIRKALESAQPNDAVIITGKGSEPWMCVEKGRKVPWDDRQIVKEELAKITSSKNLKI